MKDWHVEMKEDLKVWPETVRYCHKRAMLKNNWDSFTAYVQILLGNIWVPDVVVNLLDPFYYRLLRLPVRVEMRHE